ncbi:hypothetical protein HK103_005116 [Boothiomyces macroporosus]|uniref:Uncharacterized protein n=1 Tax=Boothiomyces macroporosus TaxID=261099 RepID=A0AAD5Y7Q0_9FUNG|nr:hypothetical protein HK103_005116 [Boothiomyces macroporosus]
MDKLLDSLSKQEDLQDTLVQTQLQTLYLKQQELQALAEKLAQLENTQMTQEQANQIQQETLRMKQKLEFFNTESSTTLQIDEEQFDGTITTAGAGQEMEEDAILDQLLNDSVVREKLTQLRQQSLELNYLEDQLANLKMLKQKMKEKQEILSQVSEENMEESLKKLSHENIESELERSEQAYQEFQNLKHDAHQHELDNEHQELLTLINAMSKHLESLEEQQMEIQNQAEQTEEPPAKNPTDDGAAIEQLMTRLFEASVKESEEQSKPHPAMELEDGEVQETIDPPLQQNEDDEDEKTLEGTYLKIQFAIEQISQQIKEVKDSERLIQTEKERSYYDLVLGKLQSQLQELVDIQNKISMYRNILTEDEKFYIAQDDLRQAVAEEIPPPVAKEAWSEHQDQKPPLPKTAESVIATKKKCCCKKESNSSVETSTSIESEIPKAPHSTPLPESLSETTATEEVLKSTSTFLPVEEPCVIKSPSAVQDKVYHELFEFKTKLSKPSSRAASVTTNTPETPRLRKLFAKHKDEIYRNAASVVSAFETKPHFILSLFKKLKLLANSESALQQIQLLVDDLVEHLDDEEESEIECVPSKSETRESAKNSQQAHIHLSNQTHIASLVIGQPHLLSFDEKIIKELTLHVNSIIYSQLTTPAYGHALCDSDSALELIERYRPMLHATLVGYTGKEVLSNWLRMVKDINRFIDKVFDWESPENDCGNENPLEVLNRGNSCLKSVSGFTLAH